jgi:hypothetical protein
MPEMSLMKSRLSADQSNANAKPKRRLYSRQKWLAGQARRTAKTGCIFLFSFNGDFLS